LGGGCIASLSSGTSRTNLATESDTIPHNGARDFALQIGDGKVLSSGTRTRGSRVRRIISPADGFACRGGACRGGEPEVGGADVDLEGEGVCASDGDGKGVGAMEVGYKLSM
jgi:hypothetical protein